MPLLLRVKLKTMNTALACSIDLKPQALLRRSSLLRSTLAGLSVLVGACSFTPTYERPAPPVAAAYPGASATPGGRAASEIPWREYFTDARLTKLIEIALANSRDLKVAALNVERARAQFQIQRADQWPTVNATAQGVSQRSSGALTPTGNGFRLEYFQSALGVTAYELDFFGRVRALGDSALAQYLSTDEASKSVQISLIAAIANNWLALIADHELLRLARQTSFQSRANLEDDPAEIQERHCFRTGCSAGRNTPRISPCEHCTNTADPGTGPQFAGLVDRTTVTGRVPRR